MNRNIEVGCLVMLIKSSMENDPDVGRVGEVVSHDPLDKDTPWEVYFEGGVHGRFGIDAPMKLRDIPVWLSAQAIIRIDNYDNSDETTEQDKELMV